MACLSVPQVCVVDKIASGVIYIGKQKMAQESRRAAYPHLQTHFLGVILNSLALHCNGVPRTLATRPAPSRMRHRSPALTLTALLKPLPTPSAAKQKRNL